MKKFIFVSLALIILALLIAITFVSSRKFYSSVELALQTTESVSFPDFEEAGKLGSTASSYVDKTGVVRLAADKGYATVVKYSDESGHVVRERYFDEDNRLTITKEGYWSYRRLYYTEGGDAGRIREIRCLDKNGLLENNSLGYAVIRRSYDNSATIDMYYDQNDVLTALSLGQYGKKTEMVSDTKITTYLDETGQPVNTNRGYAIVKRSGSKDLYYDSDELPVTIGRNQYGIEKVNGQSVYLDEDGERMVRLENVLNTHPFLVYECLYGSCCHPIRPAFQQL